MTITWKNKLFFGDNLDILREYIPDDSVDLIYLDPPFNSNATYNILFQEQSGEQSTAQITAFEDTWHWTQESENLFHELITTAPERLANLIQAMRLMLGTNDMMAYLTMMAPRLVELHRVLKPAGSIYLHCDPTASHYLKLLMDAIFGPEKFRNEITWKRTSSHNDSRRWAQINDTILFYAGRGFTWNPVYLEHDPEYVKNFYRFNDERGRYRLHEIIRTASMGPRPNLAYEYKGYRPEWGWRMVREKVEALDREGRITWSGTGRPYLKRYLHEQEGTPASSIWIDIPPLSHSAAERLGYPTQKPEFLLERIIRASSNEGDVVLDPFCGCGTTITVSERLHRRWLGIDITHLAVSLIKVRLHDTFCSELAPYEVVGVPEDVKSAEALAQGDRYQFQWWALGLIDARPAQDKKKGKDTGIDGYIYFFDTKDNQARKIIVQVKSGKVSSRDIRDLVGVLDREKAAIGAFITLQPATKDMTKEAISAGFYVAGRFGKFPRLQILTIEELLGGAKLQYPISNAATFKRAERKSKHRAEQEGLFS
ncbi:MAG: restriction endonuclease [Acidobacteria bacterium]|nr:restriction endonuclease [Acidobacteriota bacterium]